MILIISLCLLLSTSQNYDTKTNPYGQISASNLESASPTYGTVYLPGSQNGIEVQQPNQITPKGFSRLHQYNIDTLLTLKDPIGQDQNIRNSYYLSLFEQNPQNQLCFKNNFKRCFLAVGHGYQAVKSDQNPNKDSQIVAAYFGYYQDNSFNIAFESSANENWKIALANSADRFNPLNDFEQKNSDCDKQVKISDFQTVKSQYTKESIRDKILPNFIGYQKERYQIGLATQQQQGLIDQQYEDIKRDASIIFDRATKDATLHGIAQITAIKGKAFDVSDQLGYQYRRRLQNIKFQSQASLRRTAEKEGQLQQQEKSIEPDWNELDSIQDLSQQKPIDFQKYLKGQGDFEKDYPSYATQTRLLTFEEPERLLEESNGQARLLPVVAVHTIYEYTKILYTKTVLGKTIQVKFYGKCQLIISTLPSKHEIQCFGQIIYTVFSVTNTKTIFSFKKTVATNWSWNQNWGGSWAFNFAIPLPPPVSFITINFYVTVGYKIDLALTSIVKQWWYPLIHQVKAVASTQLWTDAKATLKVLAVQGGVFIKGTLVKVSTDPTVTLYYFLKPIHRLIAFWVKWYWEIIAFQFEWGFIWRYWFFGWSSWKTIAKWTVNGIYGKYEILNKVFWINY